MSAPSRNYDLPEKDVWIIVVRCKACKGFTTCAVEHVLSKRELRDIGYDVVKHNLSFSRMKLLTFRKKSFDFCSCQEREKEKKIRKIKSVTQLITRL